jgi:ketosteroid isomerase-like protein
MACWRSFIHDQHSGPLPGAPADINTTLVRRERHADHLKPRVRRTFHSGHSNAIGGSQRLRATGLTARAVKVARAASSADHKVADGRVLS